MAMKIQDVFILKQNYNDNEHDRLSLIVNDEMICCFWILKMYSVILQDKVDCPANEH